MKGGREPRKDADKSKESDKTNDKNAPSKPTPRETITARAGDGAIELPVQVLVTTGTSGAAEIFAAALDGNKRADLIGEHTLGRAALQKLVKLPENRGLWLTYLPLPHAVPANPSRARA